MGKKSLILHTFLLSLFLSLFCFCAHWKYHEIIDFLLFLSRMEKVHWVEMVKNFSIYIVKYIFLFLLFQCK